MANAQIKTILGYQTIDGQQFHTLPEAQEHTRKGLHLAIHDAAIKRDVKYAGLPKDLLNDFLMEFDKAIMGVVQNDAYKPEVLPVDVVMRSASVHGLELKEKGPSFLREQPTVAPLRPAAPVSDPLRQAMRNVEEEEAAVEREAEAALKMNVL